MSILKAFEHVHSSYCINWYLFFVVVVVVVGVIAIEVEMMKERFGKLLLGEDMSGGGKGVCTALAISNAITNLSG
jgi:hypothetical protein